MAGMKTFHDKFFDLAIVDAPYGIGEAGQKNRYREGLAAARDYSPYEGRDSGAPGAEYFETDILAVHSCKRQQVNFMYEINETKVLQLVEWEAAKHGK